MSELRVYEEKVSKVTDYSENQEEVKRTVANIVEKKVSKKVGCD